MKKFYLPMLLIVMMILSIAGHGSSTSTTKSGDEVELKEDGVFLLSSQASSIRSAIQTRMVSLMDLMLQLERLLPRKWD